MKAELTITDGCACSADQVQAKLNAVLWALIRERGGKVILRRHDLERAHELRPLVSFTEGDKAVTVEAG